MRTILIMILTCSSFLSAEFTRDNTTNVVTDSTTTLEWQDNSESNTATKTWQEAIDYCENLSLNGSTAWRLANITELRTLIDRTKKNTAIGSEFKYVGNNNIYTYWTSSTSIDDFKTKSWTIDFFRGTVDGKLKLEKAYTRCVKDTP